MGKREFIKLNFIGERLDVKTSNDTYASISGGEFQQALLPIWSGEHPPDPDLNHGVLGD